MIDRVLADPVFPKFIAALVSPFLLWVAIAMMARRRPQVLPRIYPAVKIVTWGLWISAVAWCAYSFYGSPNHFYRTYAVFWPFYGGTNLIYQWMRRRVDPTANQPKAVEGWWPAPKDKAV